MDADDPLRGGIKLKAEGGLEPGVGAPDNAQATEVRLQVEDNVIDSPDSAQGTFMDEYERDGSDNDEAINLAADETMDSHALRDSVMDSVEDNDNPFLRASTESVKD